MITLQALSVQKYRIEKRVPYCVYLWWGRNDDAQQIQYGIYCHYILNCKLIVQSTRLYCIQQFWQIYILHMERNTNANLLSKLRQTVSLFANEIYYIEMLFLDCLADNSFICFVSLELLQADIRDHLTQRRSSYNIEYVRTPRGGGGSASKVDLLKSALEINHKTSNTSVLMPKERNSNQSLSRNHADSAPKLNHTIPKNIVLPNVPVLEVIEC